MRSYNYSELNNAEISALCRRTAVNFDSITPVVTSIINDVKNRGDRALNEYSLKFDGFAPDQIVIDVPDKNSVKLKRSVKEAFDLAFNNIHAFHHAQMPIPRTVETMPGVICSREARPLDSVGLYVPGGTAVLPSSVLMLAVPATIAQCKEIVVATPPQKSGEVAPEVLYCCALAGVHKIVLSGGAQAVAALAYGTETVPKVDKILGPGNQYVTCAKMLLQNSDAMVSIDMPAGPSEVLVIADDTSNPAFVAADLLSQAEHGADSQVVLVTTSKDLVVGVQKEIKEQIKKLPRKDFAQKALANSSIVFTESLEKAVEFSNLWAPEHLIISIDDPGKVKDSITHAGSIFMGHFTPESVGDYASGTNHTLPTSGYAKMYSGVSLDSFFKWVTFQELSREGLAALGPAVEIMAESEGLEGHKQAVSIRLKRMKER